jgi:predicted MPP superfamily phosphohydrolase
LRLTRYVVPVPGAPVLKGLRIAAISDLHGGAPFIDAAKIDAVVAITNAAKPDLIVLNGDYVITHVLGGQHMPIETIAAHLRPLSAPLGVYAVIGNHDRWQDEFHITAALQLVGINVLENAHVQIATPRGVLYLAGIGDFYTHASNPPQALAGIPKNARALCITHSPDVFPGEPRICALTIAGHTHGGQVLLPFIGRPAVNFISDHGQDYASGITRDGGKVLFVSSGIGTSGLPVRFGVPPEVSFLTVK